MRKRKILVFWVNLIGEIFWIHFIIIIIIIIKIETTLQPEAELRGLHIITCTTYKYIINTIL